MEVQELWFEEILGCKPIGELKTLSNSKKPQFISVVVYVHNESKLIPEFIKAVMDPCQQNFKQCEVVFVDDSSTDNSVNVIRDYYKWNPVDYIVSIVRMGRYHGMETCMNAGRDMAIGDYVYEFDSTFIDFDTKAIMDVYDKCLEGHDIVVATTDVPIRKSSRLFYKIFNAVTKEKSAIGQESFRLISRRGINRINAMEIDIPYRKVVYQRSGLRTAKITYHSTTGNRPPRITQKYERVDLAINSFIYFTDVVEHVATAICFFFILLSVGTVAYAIVTRLMGYREGLGWLSTMLFLSVGFMGLFGVLVFIVRYLSVILEAVFKKQEYLVADIDKISSK